MLITFIITDMQIFIIIILIINFCQSIIYIMQLFKNKCSIIIDTTFLQNGCSNKKANTGLFILPNQKLPSFCKNFMIILAILDVK